MKHKFEKVTHCKFTGRKFKRPEYLYRGFLFRSEPWKNSYGHWVAIERGTRTRFSNNTRSEVQFYVDNFLDGEKS